MVTRDVVLPSFFMLLLLLLLLLRNIGCTVKVSVYCYFMTKEEKEEGEEEAEEENEAAAGKKGSKATTRNFMYVRTRNNSCPMSRLKFLTFLSFFLYDLLK